MRIENYSLIIVFMAFLGISCSRNQQNSTKNDQEKMSNMNTLALEDDKVSLEDSIYINSLIEELNGIERYMVKDNFIMFASLLRYKKDKRYDEVAMILGKEEGRYYDKNDFYPLYDIDTLDVKNGYLKYSSNQLMEEITKVYWNLSDGSKLIGTEKIIDDESASISFEKYYMGEYEKLDTKEIIPEIETLTLMVNERYKSADDENFPEVRYFLPRIGKAIQFCMNSTCLELNWSEGYFSIE